MNVLGLNGLTIRPFFDGRIGQYFTEGFFPYRWNWREQDAPRVVDAARQAFGGEDYIAIGFSDGATLTHQLAQLDPKCVGIVAHSGRFVSLDVRRRVPVLLLRTRDDIFCSVVRETKQMHEFYRIAGWSPSFLQMLTLEPTRWHAHEFSNGLRAMHELAPALFGSHLPIRGVQP